MRALVLALTLLAAPALAQEPVGCDRFKWPLEHERALLAAAVPVAGTVNQPLDRAYKVPLGPYAAAKLPVTPTRGTKPDSKAGFVNVAALPAAGTYRITLSEGAWIEVVQDGQLTKSGAFSGATGCEGIRKSVKFPLKAAPFVVEFSGTDATSISFVITADQP